MLRYFYLLQRLYLPLLLLPLPILPVTAQAQTENAAEIKYYQLAAGPLEDVLNNFARLAGITLSFPPELVAGKTSPGLEGEHAVEPALRILLGENNLFLQNNGGRFYTLTDTATQTNQAIILGPVRVEAESIQQTDERDQAYQAPASVNIITQRQIERFRGTSVGDIFQGTPGVLIGENRNSGGLDVNIRGMQGQGRVPVIVDGARQETTVYRGYSGVVSRSYIDPDLIGSIRIDKGPVMTAEGTGATGGVVSMRTISADDIIKEDKSWGVRLRGSLIGNNSGSPAPLGSTSGFQVPYGSTGATGGANFSTAQTYFIECQPIAAELCNGGRSIAGAYGDGGSFDRPGLLDLKSHAGSIAFAKRFEGIDLVLAYAEREQGNYYAGKNGPVPYLDLSNRLNRGFYWEVAPEIVGGSRFRAEERIANSNYESESWLAKASFFLSASQKLELNYLNYQSQYGELMPSQLMWLGPIAQTEGSTVDADTWTLRYQWDPTSDWLNLRLNLWHTDTTSVNRNYSGTGASTDEILESLNTAESYKRWGGDLSNRMQFSYAGKIQLDYGLAWQKEDLTSTFLDDATLSGGRDADRTETSVFTSLQWVPLEKLTLDAGIRYSRFNARDNESIIVSEDNAACTDEYLNGYCVAFFDVDYSGSAPIISLRYQAWSGIEFYLRYAEALRMPSLFESSGSYGSAPAFDVGLKPEHSKNREIGLNLMYDNLLLADDRFRFKLAYFRNHTKDYLTRTSPNLEEDRLGRFFTIRNIESASFHGVELNLDYDIGFLFVELGGTRYSFIEMCHDGSYRRDKCTDYGIANSYINNMIPPKWHANAMLGTRLFKQALELGVRATFMGQRTRAPEYDDQTLQGFIRPVPWHSYTLYDIFASYSLKDWLTVDFNIDNLTDEYYLDALSIGLVPAPGRAARLSITLQF